MDPGYEASAAMVVEKRSPSRRITAAKRRRNHVRAPRASSSLSTTSACSSSAQKVHPGASVVRRTHLPRSHPVKASPLSKAQQDNEDDLALPADPSHLGRARSFIDATAAAAGFGEKDRYRITMAVSEAVANALEHGTPCRGGMVYLGAEIEAQKLSFYVRDCGEFALVADFHSTELPSAVAALPS